MDIKEEFKKCIEQHLDLTAKDWNDSISNDQDEVFLSTQVNLRVEQHFDLAADFVVVDKQLGVFGIVQVLSDDVSRGQIEGYIENAVYFRHLLSAEKNTHQQIDGKQKETQHFKVELILAGTSEVIRKQVSQVLQLVTVKTAYLYAIGVNVLSYSVEDDEIQCQPCDLRRAFCWLLRESRSYFKRIDNKSGSAFKSIKLQDYRLQGERHFKLKGDCSMHLVHGHNGSGKSTLVEAMELALSGKIARFEQRKGLKNGRPDYGEYLRNYDTKRDLKIIIECTGTDADETYQLAKDDKDNGNKTNEDILAPCEGSDKLVNTNGFRLDQPLMDQLTRAGSTQRATVFLDAYFPDAKSLIEQSYELTTQKLKTQEKLEEALQESRIVNDGNWQEYRWTVQEDKVLNTMADDFFPIERADVSVLAKIIPQITTATIPWLNNELIVKSLAPCLSNVTKQLSFIVDKISVYVNQLDLAIDVLGRLSKWQPESTIETTDGYPDLLNQWLEIEVLLKLAGQQQLIVKTITDTQQKDNKLKGKLSPCFDQIDVNQLPDLADKLAQWQNIRDIRLNGILQKYEQKNTGVTNRDENNIETDKPILEANEVKLLNQMGDWLFDETNDERFGDMVYGCLLGNVRRTFANITIGEQNWLEPILQVLTQMKAVLSKLDNGIDDKQFALATTIVKSHIALEQLDSQVAQLDEEINKSFLNRIADMEGPLNELMALFTPARWAYNDIKLSHQSQPLQHGNLTHSVDITIGEQGKSKVDSSLIFNTAELNLFTLALFLMCARNIDNPYKVMVWDDPLQNMDELTATTLARGMAKLINLWQLNSDGKDDWQMILFFHGRDDLERFRHELSAHIYHLPWLSPVGEEGCNDIKTEPPKFIMQMQNLSTLIKNKSR